MSAAEFDGIALEDFPLLREAWVDEQKAADRRFGVVACAIGGGQPEDWFPSLRIEVSPEDVWAKFDAAVPDRQG